MRRELETSLLQIGFDAVVSNEDFRKQFDVEFDQNLINEALEEGMVREVHWEYILNEIQFDADFIKDKILDELPIKDAWFGNLNYNSWNVSNVWENLARQKSLDDDTVKIIVDEHLPYLQFRNDTSSFGKSKKFKQLVIVSKNNVSERYIEELLEGSEFWDFSSMFRSRSELSEDFILKYGDKKDNLWDVISRYSTFSEKFWWENTDKLDIYAILKNENLKWVAKKSPQFETYLKLNNIE